MTSTANRLAANTSGILTVEQRTAVNNLRAAGYMVLLLSPVDLQGNDPNDLEDDLRTCAAGIIETVATIKTITHPT